jgi:phage gpG-like protein
LIKAIGVVVRTDRATVTVGLESARVPYAWRHQMGYGVPMRKFLGYTKKANDQALKAISNYLKTQVLKTTT